jgi:hypothetical protein
MIVRSGKGAVVGILAASYALAGCTPEQAAVWGKPLFLFIVVGLILIPIVFYREWRRRQGR